MIIVDTNVVVSGLITNDTAAATARILDAMINGRIRYLLSPALLDEYRAVLLRPKITQRHGLEVSDIDELLGAIVHNAAWREPKTLSHFAPDEGDNHLWALLEAEPSAAMVTGDLRLIDIPPYEQRILRIDQYALSAE
jgi:putative PIN family toxin of toxin-antitoxin system